MAWEFCCYFPINNTQCLKIIEKVAFNIVSEYLKLAVLNSVNRKVNFNETTIGGKCQNWKIQMRHFEWFFKQCKFLKIIRNVSYQFWIFSCKWDFFWRFSTTVKKVFWESPNLFVKLNYSCFKLLLQYWLLWVLHKLSMVCEIVIVIYFIIRFFIPKLLW